LYTMGMQRENGLSKEYLGCTFPLVRGDFNDYGILHQAVLLSGHV
jgi:hypothetical protein